MHWLISSVCVLTSSPPKRTSLRGLMSPPQYSISGLLVLLAPHYYCGSYCPRTSPTCLMLNACNCISKLARPYAATTSPSPPRSPMAHQCAHAVTNASMRSNPCCDTIMSVYAASNVAMHVAPYLLLFASECLSFFGDRCFDDFFSSPSPKAWISPRHWLSSRNLCECCSCTRPTVVLPSKKFLPSALFPPTFVDSSGRPLDFQPHQLPPAALCEGPATLKHSAPWKWIAKLSPMRWLSSEPPSSRS